MWTKKKDSGTRIGSQKRFASIEKKRIQEIRRMEYQEKEDTKLRREIHSFILAKVYEGKSKEEILKRVRFVFQAAMYRKYAQFFEIWIDHALGYDSTQMKGTKEKEKKQEEAESEK